MENDRTTFLSKEAKKLLGTNHPVYHSFLGDMTERKNAALNLMAEEGYSSGWAQAVARFPTQAQEIIFRLLTEKGLSSAEIKKSVGFNQAQTSSVCAIARRLGYMEDPVEKPGLREGRIRYLESLRNARMQRKRMLENPQAALKSLKIEKGDRLAPKAQSIDKFAKAAALLNGTKTVDEHPLVPEPAAPVNPTVVVSPGLDKDPSKRVVEVSLRMTVEELDDFVKAVNAKKVPVVEAEAE